MVAVASERDRRTWVKISTDYWENFKIRELSNSGKLLHLYLITQAGKNLSDGIVPESICSEFGAKAFKELKQNGLLEYHSPKRWQIHDFTKHQTTRAKVRGNPAKGAHVTHHVKTGLYVDTCEFCVAERGGGPPGGHLKADGPIPF